MLATAAVFTLGRPAIAQVESDSIFRFGVTPELEVSVYDIESVLDYEVPGGFDQTADAEDRHTLGLFNITLEPRVIYRGVYIGVAAKGGLGVAVNEVESETTFEGGGGVVLSNTDTGFAFAYGVRGELGLDMQPTENFGFKAFAFGSFDNRSAAYQAEGVAVGTFVTNTSTFIYGFEEAALGVGTEINFIRDDGGLIGVLFEVAFVEPDITLRSDDSLIEDNAVHYDFDTALRLKGGLHFGSQTERLFITVELYNADFDATQETAGGVIGSTRGVGSGDMDLLRLSVGFQVEL